MIGQGTLRTFKYKEDFLSTLEPERARDPVRVSKVCATGDKDDNLYPLALDLPLKYDPIPRTVRGPSRRARYGYPICWSKDGFEWHPYLPAVISFHYPIFRGMSQYPDIIHDNLGYKLKDEEIRLWANVEFVMLKTIEILQHNKLRSLVHQKPPSPSTYGYMKGHAQAIFAKKVVRKSLNAFQRLLGYCSYSMAGASSNCDSDIYNRFDMNGVEVHILAKTLLATLSEIKAAANFTGIVVDYTEAYDYPAVTRMLNHGVPVYVRWPGNGRLDVYSAYHQHHNLHEFRPDPKVLDELRNPTPISKPLAIAPRPAIHSQRIGAKTSKTYNHPMEYLRQRLEEIPTEFCHLTPEKQKSAEDRLRSAREFRNMGGAKYYKFESYTIVDEETGKEKECYIRELLSKAEAKSDFEDTDNRQLWYVPLILFSPSLLNGHLGLIISTTNGMLLNSSTSMKTCPPPIYNSTMII
jgi:hypothetical protein